MNLPETLHAPNPPRRIAGRRGLVVIWATAIYSVLLVFAYTRGEAASGLTRLLAVYVQYLPIVVAGGIAMFVAARRGMLLPATRTALRWIGVGLFGMCVGMVLYIWSHEVVGEAYGVPLMGDAAFLLSYLAILIGLLTLPRRSPDEYEGWKVFLDAAVLVLGVGLLGWYFIIRPTTVTVDGPLDLAIRIAYPLLDIAFLFAVNGVLIAGGPADNPRGFRWLAAAVNAYVVAESIYQVLYYGPKSPNASLELLSEVFFTISYALFVVAAVSYAVGGRSRRRAASARPMSPLSLLATGAVAIVLSTVALRQWTIPLSPLILGIVGLTILLLLRQGLTAAQNTVLLRQQAQREGEARVAALVRHASDLIMVAEPDGTLRFVSPSAERILGITPAALSGRTLASLIHQDDSAAAASLFDGAATAVATVRVAALNGAWRELEVVATDLTGEPAIAGIVLVGRDLTERNVLEAHLRQSQKMEAVGRLAGGVAHDFNNLLTTILASTELMLERDVAEPIRDDLAIVRQAAERAAGLTSQLLAFSRQEVWQRKQVDLRLVVDDTVNLLRRLLGQDIVVEVTADTGSHRVAGDANQLAQVIVNLALNARDAMPQGGDLSLSLGRAMGDGGDRITLTIRDTGIGMDEATKAHMFEPFFTTKAAGQGTGLGLATTARIIEQHAGTIAVVSTPGGGTTLTIEMPAIAAGSFDPVPIAPRSGIGPTGSETVLLVEDEKPVRDVTERILTRLGYRVVTAAGADEAMDRIEDGTVSPDLLLTDVMMPGMTGPELATIAMTRFPELRILFISGYPGDELMQLGIGSDDVAFLQKPYTPRELADSVRGTLDSLLVTRS